jgi:hypothetical protein
MGIDLKVDAKAIFVRGAACADSLGTTDKGVWAEFRGLSPHPRASDRTAKVIVKMLAHGCQYLNSINGLSLSR